MSPCYKRGLAKNVRWYFRIRHLGFNFCSKAIYPTRKEAQVAEREKLKELEEKLIRPKPAMMIKELMEKRLDYIQEQKSKKYYKDNRRYFKTALDEWGNPPVDNITKKMVHDLQMGEGRRLKKEGKTTHAVNAMLRAIKGLFNWGNKIYDLDLKNPCNLDFLSVDKKMKYIPTDQEIKTIREALQGHYKLLFDFVDETACRVSEALKFEYKDIIGDNIILYTRKSRNSDLTPRVLPMPKCLRSRKWQGKLFGQWGNHPRFLEKIVDKHGFDWNWHNLRARRASIWANSGMTIIEIQHRLGHTSSRTTDIYLKFLGWRQNGDKEMTVTKKIGVKSAKSGNHF